MLMGMSIMREGPGYAYLAPAIYDYIAGVDIEKIAPSIDEVPDPSVRCILSQVLLLILHASTIIHSF